MTLVIVGIGLVLVLQGLNTSKMEVAHTNHRKTARQLALIALGQVESGLFWEEGDVDHLEGNFEEEDYPFFSWEIVLGDDNFSEAEDPSLDFDSYRHRDELEDEQRREDNEDDDDEEKAEEPFEKVRCRVTFPALGEWDNYLELERWVPWEQVYGEQDEDEDESSSESGSGGNSR